MITNEIIKDFLVCHYKAHIKFNHATENPTDYERLQQELKSRYREQFYTHLQSRHATKQIVRDIALLEKPDLKQQTYVLSSSIQTPVYAIKFDAIELLCIEHHPSKLLCIPFTILPVEKIRKTEKLLFAILCTLLSQIRWVTLEYGYIVYGRQLNKTKVVLRHYAKEVRKIVKDLNTMLGDTTPPRRYRQDACRICEYEHMCLTHLSKQDDLSLLGGITPKEVCTQNNRGFFTITQLSYTFRPSRRKKTPKTPQRHDYALKALALREHKTYVRTIPTLEQQPVEIFLDFEGLPDEQFVYLIGVVVVRDGKNYQYSFWADCQDDEQYIFVQLFALVKSLSNFTIYHYGSYEIQCLKKFNARWESQYEESVIFIIEHAVNILSYFTSTIYAPTYTNSLKEVAGHLNFKWSDACSSGIQSIVWRKRWELSHNQAYKNMLLRYNLEDCEALRVVREWVASIQQHLQRQDNTTDIVNVDTLKSEKSYLFGKTEYVDKNFKEIVQYAYFDYQREKIYLKTNEHVKQALKRREQAKKRTYFVNVVVEIPAPTVCPQCQHTSLYRHRKTPKVILDLKFMKNGIKRWVTRVERIWYCCSRCRKYILPEEASSLPNYGRNLMIWSVNQHVSHRVSFQQIVAMLDESFHIHSSCSAILRFKETIAKEYTSTYEEIKAILTSGSLLHVDETTVEVKGIAGSAYVWVFASMNAVLYMFRASREAEFLKDLLHDFTGVLVSDFYAGYDSLSCPQQKCLVHLIRDLNDDLFKHQLDIELKGIVNHFGELLRTIMFTIERFGLKTRYLNKHQRDVDRFYRQHIDSTYESEVAIKYQVRFTKYREKLFTFLHHDGIPWNNNNAETAIKPFAEHRRRVKANFTQNGIRDYLILLSIQQACKYRGLNFLEFLKAEEPSLDAYSRKS
jgi:predicted RecB family nuclease